MEYDFIGKSTFFPKKGILVIGDLHLGYEYTLREAGSLIPATQFSETKKDLQNILEIIKKRGHKVKKIIFLGDIKHFFGYNKGEKNLFIELMSILGKNIDLKDVIVLKGNHEKMAEIADKKLIDYYKDEEIVFIHGDIKIKEAFGKDVKYIVMGHLHPAITLRDSQNIKVEKYKCFLTGKYRGKEVIILPSFLPLVEGTSLNEHLSNDRCIIPSRNLKNFHVHIIGKEKTYRFGLLKKLIK
jgi:hypothetical protein